MRIKRFLWGTGIVLGLLLFGLLIVSTVFWKWVPAGQVAIVYNANSGVDRKNVLEPGRYVLGPLDQLIPAPTQVIPAYYTQDPDLGETKAADGIQITTRQGSTVTFDVLVLYRVEPEDIWKMFDNFARQPIEVIQSTRIRREVKNVANSVGRNFYLEELIGAKRAEANAQLKSLLQDSMKPIGFTVLNAYFVTAFPNDAQDKQLLAIATADINREIAATNARAAEKQKTIAITLAQARRDASQLVAANTTPASVQMQQLEIEQKRLEKWDGSRIQIDTTGLNSLFVDPKSLPGRMTR